MSGYLYNFETGVIFDDFGGVFGGPYRGIEMYRAYQAGTTIKTYVKTPKNMKK